MNDLAKGGLAIIAGVLTVAIVSVFVGRQSSAPAGVAAVGDALAKVIAAAVNPVGTAATNGNPALNAQTMPPTTGANDALAHAAAGGLPDPFALLGLGSASGHGL